MTIRAVCDECDYASQYGDFSYGDHPEGWTDENGRQEFSGDDSQEHYCPQCSAMRKRR